LLGLRILQKWVPSRLAPIFNLKLHSVACTAGLDPVEAAPRQGPQRGEAPGTGMATGTQARRGFETTRRISTFPARHAASAARGQG